jgi:hypothetical protein
MALENRKAGLHTRPHPHSLAGQRIPRLRDGVIVDLAVERRRRRPRRRGPDPAWFCPQRYGAHRSASIAELSERLGSLDAAYQWLDTQRAATQTLAEARRTAVVAAIDQLGWLAEQEQRRREWFASPLQVPEWAASENGAAS